MTNYISSSLAFPTVSSNRDQLYNCARRHRIGRRAHSSLIPIEVTTHSWIRKKGRSKHTNLSDHAGLRVDERFMVVRKPGNECRARYKYRLVCSQGRWPRVKVIYRLQHIVKWPGNEDTEFNCHAAGFLHRKSILFVLSTSDNCVVSTYQQSS